MSARTSSPEGATSPKRGCEGRRGYGPVLRNGRFVTLWIAQAGADLGDAFTRMALIILVTEKTTSPVALSIVMAVQMVPMIALAPLAGVLVDRWDKKRIMIASDVARAVLLVGVAASRTLGELYVLSFLVSVASQFFMPARAVAIPEVVGREHYLSAVALSQMTFQFVSLVGPGLGGGLVGFLGTQAAFLFNGVTFLLSASLIALVRFPPLPVKAGAVTLAAFGAELREGLAFVVQTRALRFIVSVFAVMVLGFGFFNILYVDYTRNVLQVSAVQFGLLESIWAVGSLLGVILVGQIGPGMSKGHAMLGGAGAAGATMLIFFLGPGLAGVAAAGLIAGVAMAFINVPSNTLFALLTPVERRGRVNGALNSLINVSGLLGLSFAGQVARAMGSGAGLGAVGLFVVVVAVTALFLPGFRELQRADRAIGFPSGASE